jgi:hypothetical protein
MELAETCLAAAALDCMDVTLRCSRVPIAPGAQIDLRRRNEDFIEAIRKSG